MMVVENNGWLLLKRKSGQEFLFHVSTGWEVSDQASGSAWWGNHQQGRNLDCANTFNELKHQLGFILQLSDGR